MKKNVSKWTALHKVCVTVTDVLNLNYTCYRFTFPLKKFKIDQSVITTTYRVHRHKKM